MVNEEYNKKLKEMLDQIPINWDNQRIIKIIGDALNSSQSSKKEIVYLQAKEYIKNNNHLDEF